MHGTLVPSCNRCVDGQCSAGTFHKAVQNNFFHSRDGHQSKFNMGLILHLARIMAKVFKAMHAANIVHQDWKLEVLYYPVYTS